MCDVSLSRGVFILAVRAPIDTREEAEDFINVDLASRGTDAHFSSRRQNRGYLANRICSVNSHFWTKGDSEFLA